ncbi:DUF58 domain-containing protein [Gorillibacterium sp. CAU 1737]|uniref:DUF58 domain-containing protein n=1 Tax=Gorillibacterium sp. CAU 1737 TaxID=3140362 RepID=UPI00325FE97D
MGRYRLFVTFALFEGAALALSLVRGGFVPWFLAGSIGLLLSYAFFVPAWGLRKASCEMIVPVERATAGESVQVKLELSLNSWIPLAWLVVRGQWTDPAGQVRYRSSRLLYPGRRQRVGFRYRIDDLERGLFQHEDVELIAGDLFGLLTLTKRLPVAQQLAVFPAPLEIAEPDRGSGSSPNDSGGTRGPEGTYRSGAIREYRPGDPLRVIHWLATARTGTLMAAEGEPDDGGPVFLLLDGRQPERFELAVRVMAGLMKRASGQGRTFRFARLAQAGTEEGSITSKEYPPGRLEEAFFELAALSLPSSLPIGEGAKELGAEGLGMEKRELVAERSSRQGKPLAGVPSGVSLTLITANPDRRLAAWCEMWSERQCRVTVIDVQEGAASQEGDRFERVEDFRRIGCSYYAIAAQAAESGVSHGTSA